MELCGPTTQTGVRLTQLYYEFQTYEQGFNEVYLRPSTKQKYTVLFVFVPEGHDTNFLCEKKLIIQLHMTNQATKFHRVASP